MADMRRGSRLGRLTIYALTLIALMMVSMVVYVLVTGEERGLASDEPEAPSAEFKNPPVLVFPERLRTFDSSLNRFIDRFIRATLEGRYDEFRQMWTRRLDPVSADKYLRIWKVVREVRVLDIQPIRTQNGTIEAYLIKAEVKEEPIEGDKKRGTDEIRWIRAVREGDEWVFAPPEKSDRERAGAAAASQAAASQTAEKRD